MKVKQLTKKKTKVTKAEVKQYTKIRKVFTSQKCLLQNLSQETIQQLPSNFQSFNRSYKDTTFSLKKKKRKKVCNLLIPKYNIEPASSGYNSPSEKDEARSTSVKAERVKTTKKA